MMLLLSLSCNHLVVNQSLQLHLFVTLMLEQIFMLGAGASMHFCIRVFILMHQAIVPRLHQRHELEKKRKYVGRPLFYIILYIANLADLIQQTLPL